MCEKPSAVSFQNLSLHLSIAQHTESFLSMCQRQSLVTTPPQLNPLNNTLDQTSIFSKIDRACEAINKKRKRSIEEDQQSKKARDHSWKGGIDSNAKSSCPKDTVLLMASACGDSRLQRQLCVSSHPVVCHTNTSPDSGTILSMMESTCRVNSPPPLNPSVFPVPESVFSIDEINEDLLHEVLKCDHPGQDTTTKEGIPVQSASCESSADQAPVQDADSSKTAEFNTASTAAPASATKTCGRGREIQSAITCLDKDNDRGSSTIQDKLFIEQLCELDASLENLSQPDFFEHFSLLDFY